MPTNDNLNILSEYNQRNSMSELLFTYLSSRIDNYDTSTDQSYFHKNFKSRSNILSLILTMRDSVKEVTDILYLYSKDDSHVIILVQFNSTDNVDGLVIFFDLSTLADSQYNINNLRDIDLKFQNTIRSIKADESVKWINNQINVAMHNLNNSDIMNVKTDPVQEEDIPTMTIPASTIKEASVTQSYLHVGDPIKESIVSMNTNKYGAINTFDELIKALQYPYNMSDYRNRGIIYTLKQTNNGAANSDRRVINFHSKNGYLGEVSANVDNVVEVVNAFLQMKLLGKPDNPNTPSEYLIYLDADCNRFSITEHANEYKLVDNEQIVAIIPTSFNEVKWKAIINAYVN